MSQRAPTARDRFLTSIAEATEDTPRILEAFRSVDRADFVPAYFLPDPVARRTWPIRWKSFSQADGAAWADRLYSPRALVTKVGPDGLPVSSSTDPLLMIEMIKALRPGTGDRILEVGTGTGYNAAILSHVVGGTGRVVSVEIDDEVISVARSRLRGYPNVRAEHADGVQGFAGEAPYQGILVTANAARVEPAWIYQLAPGGRLVVNLNGPIVSGLFAGRASSAGTLTGRFLEFPQVGFTPLHGHPTDADLLAGDIGIDSADEMTGENVSADVAAALVDDEDALAFIQFALEVRRSLHEIVGRGERQRGVAFHRGGKSCWIFLGDSTAHTGQARCGGDSRLLEDLLHAHACWMSLGAPRKADLELEIGAGGTRVSAVGRVICATRLFSPIAGLALPGLVIMLRDMAGDLALGPEITTISGYDAAAAILRQHRDFLQWDGTLADADGRLVLPHELRDGGHTGQLVPVPSLSSLIPASDVAPFGFAQTPVFLDQPQHTRFRRLMVGAWELGAAARALKERTASLAAGPLRRAADGRVEFMRSVACPVSATVLAWLFGGPPEPWIEFTLEHIWLRELSKPIGMDRVMAYERHVWDLVCSRTRSPMDDAVSRMAWHRPGGDGLRTAEIATLVLQMGFVANESVIRFHGSLASVLASDPGLRTRLRGDAAGVERLIADVLRKRPPIRGVFRRTERECAAAGRVFPPGSGVFLDFKRANTGNAADRGHLSFGTGIHRCPGAALAVMEASAIVDTLCGLPSVTMADGGCREDPIGLLEGPSELWLEL
jgi:protein-L-isoaspartate O-methyltransferase/cytochrome P450